VSNELVLTVLEAQDILEGAIVGQWYCEQDISALFVEVFVSVGPDGVLIFDAPEYGSTWYDKAEFELVSVDGDVYVFANADGEEIVCTLIDDATLNLVWEEQGIEMTEDYGCPLVKN
jgi:hypothetical protein